MPLILRNMGIDHTQNEINRPNGFPIWQILYGVSGSGVFYLDGTRGLLMPGQVALLYPGEAHRYHSVEGNWTVHYIGFDGKLCRELLFTLGMTCSGLYSLSAPDSYLRHLGIMEEQMKCQKQVCLSECSKELYALLLDLSGEVSRLPDSRFAESVGLCKDMILYLEDHYAEDLSLEDLAKQFQRTPEYLCSVFKEGTGETIVKYLRHIRIHHAQIWLLTSPDAKLKHVAAECGFHSLSYFCKIFRETTGSTPQSFRLGIAERKENHP